MAEVQRGDVVLFTGQNHVQGIGEVGHVFHNKVFADAMWPPDPVNGSWHNVYSLLAFQPALIPYQPLREALGSDPNDNFQGLRLVRDHRVDLAKLGSAKPESSEARFGEAGILSQVLCGVAASLH
jgi:hypothetical protein